MAGQVVVVRFGDDPAIGFRHRNDAARVRRAAFGRFQNYRLLLHPRSTRRWYRLGDLRNGLWTQLSRIELGG